MTARGKSQRCIAVAGLGKPPFYPAQAGRNPAERAASRPSGAARVAGAAGDGAWRREAHRPSGGAAAFGGPGAFGPRASQTKGGAGPERAPPPPLCALCAPAAPPGRWSFPPTFRAIDSLRPTDRRRSVRRRPQRHPGNFPPLGLGRGVEGSRFRGGAQRPLGTAREQSPNAGAEKRRQNTLPALMRNPVHKNNNGKNNTQRQGFKNQKVMPDIMDRPMASVSVGLWSLC